MAQIWFHLHRAWPFVLVLLAAAVLATLLLTRLRPSRSLRRSAAEVGMVVATLPWVWLILTPMQLPADAETAYLVPFTDLRAQIAVGEPLWFLAQVGGNLAVLFGFGWCSRIRFPRLTGWHAFGLGAMFSLLLEVVQNSFIGGRVFSVDDILLNALGCALGSACARAFKRGGCGPGG